MTSDSDDAVFEEEIVSSGGYTDSDIGEHQYEVAIENNGISSESLSETVAKESDAVPEGETEWNNLMTVIGNNNKNIAKEVTSHKDLINSNGLNDSGHSSLTSHSSYESNKQDYENLNTLNNNMKEDKSMSPDAEVALRSPVVRNKVTRISTFKPNEEDKLNVDAKTLEKVSTLSSNSDSLTNIPRAAKSIAGSDMSIENVSNHNELNQAKEKKQCLTPRETEELIQYFREKASESRAASMESLDAIDEKEQVEIPVVVPDLALSKKQVRQNEKHKSLKERKSLAVTEDNAINTRPSSLLNSNQYSFSNIDVRNSQDGVWKKHRRFGFFRFFRKKKHGKRKSASMSHLPSSSRSEEELRQFDLAEGVKINKHKKKSFNPFRRAFGGKKRKTYNHNKKSKKGFSLRNLTGRRKKTHSGFVDITISPSEVTSGVDDLPTGKYVVKESIFQENNEQTNVTNSTSNKSPMWASSVEVVTTNDINIHVEENDQTNVSNKRDLTGNEESVNLRPSSNSRFVCFFKLL